MALLNISQASRVADKTRNTIYKHIKSGKLSVAKVEDGMKWIDPAELERVYGSLKTPDTVSIDMPNTQKETPQIEHLFQGQIKRLEDEVQRLLDQMDDLKEDRDEWRSQAKKQTLLLTAAQEQEQKPTPSLWQWLIGRKTA